MSVITNVYDQLNSLVATTLPTHSELTNPYFPEASDELTIEKAYGIAFGAANNPNLENGNTYSMQRDFEIVLTRKVYSGLQMRNADAVAVRKTAEKALFEDQISLIQAMLNNITLGQLIVAVDYVSDSGLEFATNGKSDLIILRSVFQVRYTENL